ncbi:MAG TPA: tetratricopeptide repeat protein, partial [Pirellulaceae bacterium]|nr:tetratricopeptide repeat protein [Pirellulaceae bacterium]
RVGSDSRSESTTLASIAAARSTEPARLTKLVRGELDWIVMKALEKDRNRRYETAKDVAADVQRYLADEAVQACPPSVGYRLRKFVRRNKGGLAAAAAALLFIVTIAGGLGWIVRDREARQTRLAGQVELILEEADRMARQQKWPEALAAAKRAEPLLAAGEADEQTHDQVRQVLADLELVKRLEEARFLGSQVADGTWNRAGAERAYASAFAEAGFTIEGVTVGNAADQLRTHSRIVTELAAALTGWAQMRKATTMGADESSWQHLLAVADEIDSDPWRRSLRAAWKKKEEGAESLRQLANSADVRILPPSTVALLANALRDRISPDEAAKPLLRAQQVYPADFSINFELAGCLSNCRPQRLDEAVIFYHVALGLRPGHPFVFNNLGVVRFDQGKLDEAVACFRKAIEFEPRHAMAHSNLGTVLGKQKKLNEAIWHCRKAIELDPKSAAAHTNLGNAVLDQKKLNEAFALYYKAIELDPASAKPHNNLGWALQKQGKLNEAIASYQKAIELDPTYTLAHCNLGNALCDQGKLDEAIACLRQAIERDPKSAMPHNNLGNALRDQKKVDEAITCFRKAIELDPRYAAAHASLGDALSIQNKFEQAVACCRKGIELDPKSAAVHNCLGGVLHRQQKFDDAIVCFKKAIELDPEFAPAYSNLGTAFDAQKKFDQATGYYRKAIELNPNDALAYSNLGNTLRKQGKLSEAEGWLRKAIELGPKLALAHTNLGTVLRKQGKLDEALISYRWAIELDPKDAAAYIGLGNILGDQGKPDEAIACYRKATELAPKCALAHTNLGIALAKQGKFDDAIAWLRKAIELDPKDAGAHNSLGLALRDLRDPTKLDEAIAHLRKAVELDPKRAGNHLNLGLALTDQGKLDEAAACLRTAIQRDSKSPAGYNSLGIVLYRQKKHDDAIACFRKAIELDSKDARAHNNLGIAIRALTQRLADGPDAKGCDAVTQVVEQVAGAYVRRLEQWPPPGNHNWLLNGMIYLSAARPEAYRPTCVRLVEQFGQTDQPQVAALLVWCCKLRPDAVADWDAVVRMGEKALGKLPDNRRLMHDLGAVLYRAGRFEQALERLEESVRLRPEKKAVVWDWLWLAMVHHRLGDTDKARDWLRQAQQWIDQQRDRNVELGLLRTEAEELLRIEPTKPKGK